MENVLIMYDPSYIKVGPYIIIFVHWVEVSTCFYFDLKTSKFELKNQNQRIKKFKMIKNDRFTILHYTIAAVPYTHIKKSHANALSFHPNFTMPKWISKNQCCTWKYNVIHVHGLFVIFSTVTTVCESILYV